MAVLRRLALEGYRSIKSIDLEFRQLNVLIGANGAGKSNLISFFKLLNEMMAGRLQEYVARAGRAQSILHFGPKTTPQLAARMEFDLESAVNTYSMRLFHAAGDTLVFADESLQHHKMGYASALPVPLGAGHQESWLGRRADDGDITAKTCRHLLNGCRVYHFHDTSPAARARQFCYVGDNRRLQPDAGNLAAYLLRLRGEEPAAYGRIVSTVRQVAPFFDSFDLEPEGPQRREVMLNWRMKGADNLFGPHQLSDGTLRAVCLVSLLLMPERELPDLVIVDEPELGLHPYALDIIAGLFRATSHHAQVLVSTQSSAFLDCFGPEDVVIAEREGMASTFSRPDAAKLESWLEEYSLGEIWEKNVIGAGPH